jgi:hypothetical protein
MADEPQGNRPLESFTVGGLLVSLWENEADNADGTTRKYRTVTIRKSFSNRNGELDSRTVSLNPGEVSCMVGLLHRIEDAVFQRSGQTPF